MIYQLFHQHKTTNKLVLAGQSGDISNIKQMDTWKKAISEDMPLPDGYQWMICNSKSKYFDHEAVLVHVGENT